MARASASLRIATLRPFAGNAASATVIMSAARSSATLRDTIAVMSHSPRHRLGEFQCATDGPTATSAPGTDHTGHCHGPAVTPS
ncbi:hypothetical protein GCM10023148_40200 [Actinokineospora soli]